MENDDGNLFKMHILAIPLLSVLYHWNKSFISFSSLKCHFHFLIQSYCNLKSRMINACRHLCPFLNHFSLFYSSFLQQSFSLPFISFCILKHKKKLVINVAWVYSEWKFASAKREMFLLTLNVALCRFLISKALSLYPSHICMRIWWMIKNELKHTSFLMSCNVYRQ